MFSLTRGGLLFKTEIGVGGCAGTRRGPDHFVWRLRGASPHVGHARASVCTADFHSVCCDASLNALQRSLQAPDSSWRPRSKTVRHQPASPQQRVGQSLPAADGPSACGACRTSHHGRASASPPRRQGPVRRCRVRLRRPQPRVSARVWRSLERAPAWLPARYRRRSIL